jgi:hypothetical protein
MKSKISKIIFGTGTLLALPMLVSAQVPIQTGFGGFVFQIIGFITRVIELVFPIVTGILVLLFAYQVIEFLRSKEDIEKHEKLKARLGNAFIALFIWFTLFGLINVLGNAFGLNPGRSTVQPPTVDIR